jgi:hypothetical protein
LIAENDGPRPEGCDRELFLRDWRNATPESQEGWAVNAEFDRETLKAHCERGALQVEDLQAQIKELEFQREMQERVIGCLRGECAELKAAIERTLMGVANDS